MLRLTFTLVVALYAGFAIWGDPGEEQAEAAPKTEVLQLSASAAPISIDAPTADPTPEVTRTETADIVVPSPAAIAAATPPPALKEANPLGEPRRISLVDPALSATPASFSPEAPAPAETSRFMEVTGSRVNLRSGPSTGNAVVDSLVRGTLVEPIGEEQNGWIQLRAIESGVTGYMAARFIAPAG